MFTEAHGAGNYPIEPNAVGTVVAGDEKIAGCLVKTSGTADDHVQLGVFQSCRIGYTQLFQVQLSTPGSEDGVRRVRQYERRV
jgi:hypothetical protein